MRDPKQSWEALKASDKPLTIDDLSQPDIRETLSRLGKMSEGVALETFLMKVMIRIPPLGADFGAFGIFEGERRLARLLLNLLNGTEHGPGRNDRDDGNDGNPGRDNQ